MTKPNFNKHMEEDARLVILRELAEQTNYSLIDTMLQKVCESFGHNRSREWIRTQLRKLAELNAIALSEVGEDHLVATLTMPGHDHLLGRARIEGVARPSPKA